MREDPQVASAGSLPRIQRRRWSAWIAEVKRRRRLARAEELEVIERLAREARRRYRSADYVPGLGSEHRRC
jgi:hypothetical protein